MELKQKLKNNLLLFAKTCLPQLFYHKFSYVHKEIADLIQSSETRINIMASRGLAKSTILGRLVPLHILLNSDYPETILLASKSQGLSIQHLQIIKDALDYNPAIRKIYGYHGSQSAKIWRDDRIVLNNGNSVYAKGTGQHIRGINLYSRVTYFLFDDIEDENNTLTPESMDKNLKWFMDGALPSLDNLRGRAINIGTPIRENCIVARLMNIHGWASRCYPAMINKKSVWEDGIPTNFLMDKEKEAESMGRLGSFMREYMCEMYADEEQLFRKEYFQYYNGYVQHENGYAYLIIDCEKEKKKIPVNIFMGIDPATSVERTADFFAIVSIAVDNDLNIYVLPYIRRRLKPTEAIQCIIDEYNKYKPEMVTLETSGAQEAFRDILRNIEGIYIPGMESKVQPRDKKSKRYIEVLEPFFYKRKVFMLNNMEDLSNELLMFPRAKHDDLVDALYYAVKRMYPPTHTTTKLLGGRQKEVEYNWKTCF